MIEGLKPYREYSDSPMPWAGRLPSHWNAKRAKWLFTKLDRPVPERAETVTCFRDGTVTLRKNRRLRGFTEAIYELGYQGICKGDLVIHGMDAFAGAVGVSDSNGKGSPVYAVCQPKPGINAHYYAFIIREMSRSQWILALARGIRERSTDFRYDVFGAQRVPLPPPDEQDGIVRFLEYANGRVERAIRAKKKLIALLNEQKQVIIHRAVTRGLDPTVTLKPSGIPWLGDIPKHWKLPRLGAVFRERGETNEAKQITQVLSLLKDVGVIPYEQKGKIGNKKSDDIGRYKIVRPDDIVVNCMNVIIGSVGLSSHTGCLSPVYYVLTRRFEEDNPKYLNAVFQSKPFQQSLVCIGNGIMAHRMRIPMELLKAELIPVPSPTEQTAIVKFLEHELASFDAAIARAEREMGLLREYRTRLAADVVTGKLDVREAAKQLPATTEAPAAEPETEELTDDEATELVTADEDHE